LGVIDPRRPAVLLHDDDARQGAFGHIPRLF